jgi:hypothetical protein
MSTLAAHKNKKRIKGKDRALNRKAIGHGDGCNQIMQGCREKVFGILGTKERIIKKYISTIIFFSREVGRYHGGDRRIRLSVLLII